MSKFKVVEIFRSISGESINSGEPAVFIRLYGCNLRCKYSDVPGEYCDTPYGYEGDNYTLMTAAEIYAEVVRLSNNYHGLVILTGGEPLLHSNVCELLRELLTGNNHFRVEVETNGSLPVIPILKYLSMYKSSHAIHRLCFTFDYKCPSSGMESQMMPVDTYIENINSAICSYKCNCVIKYVVKNKEDLEAAAKISDMILSKVNWDVRLNRNLYFYISPVFGADLPSLVDYMLNDPVLSRCRFQLQIHKYIWDPNLRGV